MSQSQQPASDDAHAPRIPTDEEIATLPRWAIVAFAARCAERVCPLYEKGFPKATVSNVAAVRAAVDVAGAAAAAADDAYDDAARDYAVSAASAAYAASATSATSARAAARAARAAVRVAVADDNVRAGRAGNVAYTANAALAAANADIQVRSELYRDFILLRETASQQDWNNDTPVPQSVFGPMWPNGAPDGWPEEADYEAEPQAIEFSFALPPMPNTPETRAALKASIRRVLEAANAVHLAEGGSGLQIAGAKVYKSVQISEGV